MDFWMGFFTDFFDGSKEHTALAAQITLIMGFLTLLVTMFTAHITRNTLKSSVKNTRRDEFNRHFTLLLEQHNGQLDIVKKYLDGIGKTPDGNGFIDNLGKPIEHLAAFNSLRGHRVISPYMRVLYHLLKFIDQDFYVSKPNIKDQKKFTSLVRSLIRNDVLFLIAVNSSYIYEEHTENQYADYQRLLAKFNFFEHALFFDVIKPDNSESETAKNNPSMDSYLNSVRTTTTSRFRHLLGFDVSGTLPEKYSLPLPFVISCIFDNPSYMDCRKIMGKIDKEVLDAIDTVLKEKIEACEKQIQVGFMFSDFIGKTRVAFSSERLSEINSTGVVDISEFRKGEEVTTEFIERVCNEEIIERYSNLLFCWELPRNHSGHCIAYNDFNKFKTQYHLFKAWQAHHKKLKGDYMKSLRQKETSYWCNVLNDINSQCRFESGGSLSKLYRKK